MSLKSFALAVVAVGIAVSVGAIVPARAETPLDKAAVEKIIHDYIMENPTVIMDSVDGYQKKTLRDRSSDAIKNNIGYLFKDDDAPYLGDRDGDVRIVEFFDYNCGYCKKVFPELLKLVEKDKKVKIIFKDIPILGPTSETAAKWALAAHMQKKFFGFHRALMEHKGPINDEVLQKAAKAADMDVNKAKEDAEGTTVLMQVEKNRALAGQLGITGTPAFVVGEEVVPGAVPLEELEKMIADERKKAPKAEDKKEEKKKGK
jgi:protein-disulfide isomerase